MSEQDTIEHADEVVDAKPTSTAVTALDPLERCRSGLAELDTEYNRLVALEKPDDDAERKYRLQCVKLRTALDDAYETINRPLLATQRDARKLRDDLKGGITKFEDPIDARIKEREAEANRRREQRIEQERARRAERLERISAIASVARRAVGKPSSEIEAKIKLVAGQEIGEDYGDLQTEAEHVRAEALSSLRDLLTDTKAREAQAAELQAERDRIARSELFQTRLHNLRSLSVGLGTRSSETIAAALAGAEAFPIGPEWQEFAGQATEARDAVVAELRQMHADASERERVTAEQAAEAERLAAAANEQRRVENLQIIERERQRQAQSRLDQDRLHHACERAIDRAGAAAVEPVYRRFESDGPCPLSRVDEYIAALDALQPELPEKNAQGSGPSPADAPAPGDAPATCASSEPEAAQGSPSGDEGQDAHAEERAPEPAPADDGRRLKLGDLCLRLGFTVDRQFITSTCGVQPAGTEKRAILFRACDWPAICDAIVRQVTNARERYQ